MPFSEEDTKQHTHTNDMPRLIKLSPGLTFACFSLRANNCAKPNTARLRYFCQDQLDVCHFWGFSFGFPEQKPPTRGTVGKEERNQRAHFLTVQNVLNAMLEGADA